MQGQTEVCAMDNSYHYTENPIPAEPPWGRVSDAADCNLDRPAKTLPAILCPIGAVSQNELGGHPPAPCRPSVQDSPPGSAENHDLKIAAFFWTNIATTKHNSARRGDLGSAASCVFAGCGHDNNCLAGARASLGDNELIFCAALLSVPQRGVDTGDFAGTVS